MPSTATLDALAHISYGSKRQRLLLTTAMVVCASPSRWENVEWTHCDQATLCQSVLCAPRKYAGLTSKDQYRRTTALEVRTTIMPAMQMKKITHYTDCSNWWPKIGFSTIDKLLGTFAWFQLLKNCVQWVMTRQLPGYCHYFGEVKFIFWRFSGSIPILWRREN